MIRSPCGSFQDLALDLQFRHPAAQRCVLPGLRGLGLEPARIRCAAVLPVLLQPVAEIRLTDAQLTGNGGDRPARRPHQSDRIGLKFRRELPALLSHRDSLRQAQPGRSGVHHTGGGSVRDNLLCGRLAASLPVEVGGFWDDCGAGNRPPFE